MRTFYDHRIVRFLVGSCLCLVCLAACSSQPAPTPSSSTPLPRSSAGVSRPGSPTASSSTPLPRASAGASNPSNTTIPMPPTQTACPPAGTARAAVIRPLARGSDATIVYRKGSFAESLVRYDVVTHQRTTILSLNVGGQYSQAQISRDGQWLLFVAPQRNGQGFENAIQLVRLDGRGLQTLYCASATAGPSIVDMQWDLDDNTVIFSQGSEQGGPASYSLQVMDLSKGIVQQELVKPATMMGFFATTWLDQTHVYLVNEDSNGFPQALYLLDTTRGSRQSVNELTQIRSPAPAGTAWSFDTSLDGTKIYTAQCQIPEQGTIEGPSTISVEPATGGQSTTIYSDQTLAIITVRIVTGSLLAYVVDNQGSAGTAENGLWKMNTDGTGSTRLTTSLHTELNPDTQYFWSNFSRDGSRYAVQFDDGQQHGLLFGSLIDTAQQPTILEAEANDLVPGTSFFLVGWTTLS